jgi:hypothetical protein
MRAPFATEHAGNTFSIMASFVARIPEASMTARLSSLLLLAALLATLPATSANAKDKDKKASLPAYVLRASTVLVVIHPDAGEPIDDPTANITARTNVEEALRDWGRLQPLLEGQETDLVIAVRTGSGKLVQRTIRNVPMDGRTGIGQTPDGGIRIGAQQGHPPPLNDPTVGPQDTGPRTSNEVGPTQDTFEVYRGGIQKPLESSPVWRYTAKDCLRAPKVSAVEEFRKAIADAEKLQLPKKP